MKQRTRQATPAPAPPKERLSAAIESLLFVADGPVTISSLAQALGVSMRALTIALDELTEICRTRGIRVQRVGDRAQLITDPAAAVYVERFLGSEGQQRLSSSALETLAIIAYRQPITRAAIEALRGVNCERSIATLRARHLIDEAGKAEGVGRPTLWATTVRFLEHFGIERPEDLPSLEGVSQVLQESAERAS